MVDNCRVNEVVRYYLETAKNKDMTGFYLLHEKFDRLTEHERSSVLLDILYIQNIRKKQENGNL